MLITLLFYYLVSSQHIALLFREYWFDHNYNLVIDKLDEIHHIWFPLMFPSYCQDLSGPPISPTLLGRFETSIQITSGVFNTFQPWI